MDMHPLGYKENNLFKKFYNPLFKKLGFLSIFV